jgi:hypothetical protein
METNGIPTNWSRRYSKWGYGSGVIPESFAMPGKEAHNSRPSWFGGIKSDLDQIWRLGGKTAIVHAESEDEWDYVSHTATVFYEEYGAEFNRLVFVDELADFFTRRSLGDIFQRISRNGRERNVALVAGSQRPRKVPLEVLTEMQRLYLFEIDFLEDLQRVFQFGIPKDVIVPTGHTFYMYDRKLKLEGVSDKYYNLDLTRNIYNGQMYNQKGAVNE